MTLGRRWYGWPEGDYVPFRTIYQTPSVVYIRNEMQKDTGTGTYTGTNDALIENPADIVRHLLVKRGNGIDATNDFNLTSGGGLTLGSFGQARTDLNATCAGDYRLVVSVNDVIKTEALVKEILRHCPGIAFYRNPQDGKFQLVCYQTSPSAEKLYTPAFSWDSHIEQKAPFIIRESSVDDVCTRVYVHYRFCHALGNCLRTAFITPTDSDDGEGNTDTTRESSAATMETRYNTQNTWEADFPMIADSDVALALLNYIFDRVSTTKLEVEFTTFLNAANLRLGHVISFNADLDAHIVYPKYGGTTTWANKYFQVTQNRRSFKKGVPELYTINAVEV